MIIHGIKFGLVWLLFITFSFVFMNTYAYLKQADAVYLSNGSKNKKFKGSILSSHEKGLSKKSCSMKKWVFSAKDWASNPWKYSSRSHLSSGCKQHFCIGRKIGIHDLLRSPSIPKMRWLIDHVGRRNMLWTWKLFCPLKKFFKFLFQNDVSKECDVDGPLEESKDNYPTLISPL